MGYRRELPVRAEKPRLRYLADTSPIFGSTGELPAEWPHQIPIATSGTSIASASDMTDIVVFIFKISTRGRHFLLKKIGRTFF